MKILFCSPFELSRDQGGPKHLQGILSGMRALGWETDTLAGEAATPGSAARYEERLRDHLRAHAARYDVVEYDHGRLPFPRSDFPARTLMVARSISLAHHYQRITPPMPLRARLRHFARLRLGWRTGPFDYLTDFAQVQRTLAHTDLLNVGNEWDRRELLRTGFPGERIAVIPCGLDDDVREGLLGIDPSLPDLKRPVIAYVGRFGFYKGLADFPKIAGLVFAQYPGARLRLLGTDGMLKGEDAVLGQFPEPLRARIEVIPRYAPQDLPRHLAGCAVGIFPSYVENFGLGALEMMAAAMPVAAYRVPGPGAFLPESWLVGPGDVRAMAGLVLRWLHDDSLLAQERQTARGLATPYTWQAVARATDAAYREALDRIRTERGTAP